MDLVTLALAKAYTDKNRLAHDGPLDIEWDGVIGDKYSILFMPNSTWRYVKVSDYVPTIEELQNFSVYVVGPNLTLDTSTLQILEDMSTCDFTTIGTPATDMDDAYPVVSVVRKPCVVDGLTLGETGVYFMSLSEENYVAKLHLDKFARKIPNKYLPDGVPWTEPVVNIEWDGNFFDGRYYLLNLDDNIGFAKVSDYLPPMDTLTNVIMTISKSGTETESIASIATEMSDASFTVLADEDAQGIVLIVREAGYSMDTTFVFKETGIYFMASGHYVSKLRIGGTVHRLPAEYAPEIPFFDLTEMGLPAIVVDTTGAGTIVETNNQDTGVDFTEFENALQNGLVRIRATMDMGGQSGPATAVCAPVFIGNEEYGYWELNFVVAAEVPGQTLRTTILLSRYTTSLDNYEKIYRSLKANCVMLQHFTM